MKVGLVCRHFLSTKGGLERYTVTLAAELLRRGHDVHVFAHSGERLPGLHFHPVPFFPLSSPGKNLSFAFMASRRIAPLRLDVVQSMERIWRQDIFRASDGINPVQMAQRYPNPWLRRFKAVTPRRRALTFLERRIFERRGARFIMTNSRLVRDQVLRHYRVSEDRVRVIYNSVDTSRFNPNVRGRLGAPLRRRYGIGPEERLILFAGNEFKLKGLSVLLEAVAGLGAPNIRIIVAGSDSADPYRSRARRLGLGEAVVFVGYQKALEGFYGAADLFALPTRYDPFANVCLEAMACGTPVVTTRMNGVSEVIETGRDGFVLRDVSVAELTASLRAYLAVDDPRVLGARACQKAASFTMEAHMRDLLALYADVIEDKRS
ncbi:MAG: glycosyltransferase family 4 protein [Syntrophales bacterium]|jgi:UDP-glucose:(heptosyl)LPS alpha-1,3-glucosyltransferase|nr:glycosyltransferase family 4 protein [Syntrophales bacterium]